MTPATESRRPRTRQPDGKPRKLGVRRSLAEAFEPRHPVCDQFVVDPRRNRRRDGALQRVALRSRRVITHKVLTSTLRGLERDGMVLRQSGQHPPTGSTRAAVSRLLAPPPPARRSRLWRDCAKSDLACGFLLSFLAAASSAPRFSPRDWASAWSAPLVLAARPFDYLFCARRHIAQLLSTRDCAYRPDRRKLDRATRRTTGSAPRFTATTAIAPHAALHEAAKRRMRKLCGASPCPPRYRRNANNNP